HGANLKSACQICLLSTEYAAYSHPSLDLDLALTLALPKPESRRVGNIKIKSSKSHPLSPWQWPLAWLTSWGTFGADPVDAASSRAMRDPHALHVQKCPTLPSPSPEAQRRRLLRGSFRSIQAVYRH